MSMAVLGLDHFSKSASGRLGRSKEELAKKEKEMAVLVSDMEERDTKA
jgi:hypothetical protein